MNEPSPIPAQLAAGIGLAVAALAAVGLTGSALIRSVSQLSRVRNNHHVRRFVGGPCTGVIRKIPAAGDSSHNRVGGDDRCRCVPGGLQRPQREQPAVLLAGEPEADGSTSVTVTVKGSGLATQDQLDVQVLGLKTFHTLDRIAVSLCEQSYTWSKTNSSGVELDTYLGQQGLAADDATLLSRNRLGPDSDGVVDTSFTLEVPKGAYSGICAFSPLPSDTSQAASNSAAYLRIPADGA